MGKGDLAMEGFKYDVAFSFLSRDEELAININDHLEGRVKTFLYSEQQKEVGGTDGYESFGRVFGQVRGNELTRDSVDGLPVK